MRTVLNNPYPKKVIDKIRTKSNPPKPKLCYILGVYDEKSSTHYYHLHELLTHLSSTADIFLFAESGNRRVNIPGIKRYYVQKYSFLPFRLMERILILFKIYLTGYHKFYCHYADFTTILCALFTRIFGGSTYKWHCVQEHYYQKPLTLKFLKEKILREFPLYLSLRCTQYLVTSSILVKNYYHQRYGIRNNKIIVVPNFINLARFKPAVRNKLFLKKKLNLPSKPIALFVHRLSNRKGADRLIGYAQSVKQHKFNYLIVAIGAGPLLKHLKSQVANHSLASQLLFIGPIPNQLLSKYYQAADIFFMPSKVEEFARVQLEAMASGLPIVAAKTLATDAMLNSTQKRLVLPQSKHQQIPYQIHQVLSDRDYYRTIVKSGQLQVAKYSLDNIAARFYQKIILPI